MSTLHRLAALPLVLSIALAAGCGAVVTAADAPVDAGARVADAPVADAPVVDAPVADAPVVDAPVVEPAAPSCAAVQAECGPEPRAFVRGHAAGLAGLEGARVRFAMRYLAAEGEGLGGAHGVVAAGATVRGGAFEACVCMPHGASGYPQVAAVVFAPGSVGETGRDVARAMFSQRYATLGDEDVSMALAGPADAPVVEAALAALVERTRRLRVTGLAGGAALYAGLVADERPVAAQVATAPVVDGAATLDWNMPGRPWPTERLAVLLDRNANRRCDDGDLGAVLPLGDRATLDLAGAPLAQGPALEAACLALRVEASRE